MPLPKIAVIDEHKLKRFLRHRSKYITDKALKRYADIVNKFAIGLILDIAEYTEGQYIRTIKEEQLVDILIRAIEKLKEKYSH